MLDEAYKEKLDEVLNRVDGTLQLPNRLADFFSVRGDSQSSDHEERKHIRMRARTRCVGYVESSLPAMNRQRGEIPIYTADFSKGGCGFLSSIQLFPTEIIRLVLPTFWLKIKIVRCRKLGENCYESGGEIISKNQPCLEAFL
ncbi:PilZ domain-containing protein [Pirellulaceae bacterium SH449]